VRGQGGSHRRQSVLLAVPALLRLSVLQARLRPAELLRLLRRLLRRRQSQNGRAAEATADTTIASKQKRT